MVAKLFIDGITPSDNYYSVIRDKPHCAHYKSCMEKMWTVYYPYADKDYQKQLTQDFHARFWEMYLTCILIHHSFNVVPKQTRSKGPDILIDDTSQRIFIEAVTPSGGADNNIDRVPTLKFNTPEQLPDTEITLRYSGAIADKYKKYANYLKQGILTPSDSYIIALNSCKIGIMAKVESSDLPRIIKSVLPFGPKQVSINKFSGSTVPWHYQYRPNISRSSGCNVPTDLFLRDEYAELSGVLYSHSNVANLPEQIGDDFIFIHNPKSTQNAIPHGYFKLGKEYSVDLGQNLLSCKDWRNNI